MSLALELGEVDVDGMLARVPSHRLSEWMAFFALKATRDKDAVDRAREADEVIDPRA